jgi:hypothetical protein
MRTVAVWRAQLEDGANLSASWDANGKRNECKAYQVFDTFLAT